MKFYTEAEILQITEDLERAVTIAVNFVIKAEHRVYDLNEMKKILKEAKKIVLHECGCKAEFQNCNSPRRVCIQIDGVEEEELDLQRYKPEEISLDEALEVLEMSHKANLVHMAYIMKDEDKPSIICSCCPCCCHTLGSLVRNGIHTQILTSTYVAVGNRDKCIDCGQCVERCVFQTRWMKERELVYDQTRCFGCGLCVSTCPKQAISLVPRKIL
ncbi:MAG: ATP-binding protein, partial [Candidatus Heimdallarchaeota archaeon]